MIGKAELSVKAYAERTPTREAPAGAFTLPDALLAAGRPA